MAKNRQTLISAKEAAARLNESPRTVQRKARAGMYPAHKFDGTTGAYVFTEADIAAILRKRGRAA
jgi:hypothetical protein